MRGLRRSAKEPKENLGFAPVVRTGSTEPVVVNNQSSLGTPLFLKRRVKPKAAGPLPITM